jgi:hypothetical protein
MGSYTIKDTTSVVQISLQNQSSYPYIVYLPALDSINSVITIRDGDGLASLTRSIVITAISGASFTDGTTTKTINQPYGFITLRVVSNSQFTVLNSFAFPADIPNPSVNTLITDSVNYKDNSTYISTFISSGLFFTGSNQVGNVLATELVEIVNNLGTIGYLSSVSYPSPDTPVYVLVGSTIQYSIDGIHFTTVNTRPGNAVKYANGKFVTGGQSNIQVSSDGMNWNLSVKNGDVAQVSYGRGLWHAVGTLSSILYSVDAQNWISASVSNPLTNATGIAYGGVWVATGESYFSLASIPWSQDGLNWNYANSFPVRDTTQKDVAFDGTQFIAVITNSSPSLPNIAYSTDGSNWSYTNVQGAAANNTWNYIGGNGQVWVVTGMGMSYSIDGLTWTPVPQFMNTTYEFRRPSWDGEQWWVGEQTLSNVWTSKNGITWSQTITGQSMGGLAKRPALSETSYILPRMVAGLGSQGYISSTQLASTVNEIYEVSAPILQTFSTVFQYTGFNQIFNVPGNISTLEFYMWGAGGGGPGNIAGATVGGGAAFQQGTLLVNPFDSIQIVVGQGGINGYLFATGTPVSGTYGGGGAGSIYAGAGGGRSAIILNEKEIVTAGGGGGAIYITLCTYDGNVGSANGDGTTSSNGAGIVGSFMGGGGGSSNNPGIGGTGNFGNPNGQNGYYLQGGAGLYKFASSGAGGGGGGYFGGGGGSYSGPDPFTLANGGGGGGGSYYDSNYVRNFQSENGNLNVPGGITKFPYYQQGVGYGTPAFYETDGGSGLIVLVYTLITSKAQVSPEGLFQNLYIENLTTNNIQVRQPRTPLYVAVGNDTNSIKYSYNGQNWSNGNNPFNQNKGYKVSWNGSYWLAAGQDNSNGSVKYSQDGITWINTTTAIFQASTLNVKWNGKIWLALGTRNNNLNYTTINYSYNGFSWLKANSVIDTCVNDAAWNGNMWVAVGYDTNHSSIAYSYDGIIWSNSNITNNFIGVGTSIGWNGSLWVATALSTNTSTIKYSTNGSNWSDIVQGGFIDNVNKVEWNGQYWLTNGTVSTSTQYISSMIQVSENGSNWSNTLNGTNFTNNQPSLLVRDIIWDGRKWIITGDNSYTSSIKYSGLDDNGNFIWFDVTTGGFSGGGFGIAYNIPQTPFLQNSNFAIYERTITQPLYDTPSNNFIKTTETYLNINNALYVNVSTIASTNITYFNSRVGIFQPNVSSFDLELARDSAFKPGAGGYWSSTSDRRVKENIQGVKLETCVSTLMALPLRTFSYCSSFTQRTGVSQEQRYGLLAQEVQIPNTVTKKAAYGFDDFHYLNTDQIHYIHLGATQALIQQREQQLSTTKALLERLNIYKNCA